MDAPRSPEPVAPARGGLAVLLLLALAAAAALAWAGRGEFASHRAWWFGGAQATASLDLRLLTPALAPADLARLLGRLPLQCTAAPEGRACAAPLAGAGGVPASVLRAQWAPAGDTERLRSVEILVPWWAHHTAARALVEQLGAPALVQAQAVHWRLAEGSASLARAPGWNPWRWIALRWDAPAAH